MKSAIGPIGYRLIRDGSNPPDAGSRHVSVCCTLWLFNIAMENGPFIDDFPIEPSIYKGFSMAILNNQMVICSHVLTIPWAKL